MQVCDHIPQKEYPAGAAAALFLISRIVAWSVPISNQRDEYGNETYADMELACLAVPRRVFTLSQIKYVEDRMKWLYDNRKLIGGLRFVYEPLGSASSWEDWDGELTGLRN